MVKALHRAGIGVILDVVLNHTAEGNEHGPVICFKGMGNEFFYHLDPTTAAAIATSPAAATRSTAIIRLVARCCCSAWSTGCATCTWTASASIWPA
jgi:pullulanase/glycogen debranching enzyme